MSAVPIQRTDAQEAEYRAAWLNQNKAPKNWVVLTIEEVAIIRADLSRVTNDWHRLGKLLEEYEHAQVGLKRDLARVTAERDHWIALYKERNKTAAILEDTSIALRARVAELVRELSHVAECSQNRDAENMLLQQRNAELVAALEKIAKSDPLANGRYAAHNAAQALARAESTTPAKEEVSR